MVSVGSLPILHEEYGLAASHKISGIRLVRSRQSQLDLRAHPGTASEAPGTSPAAGLGRASTAGIELFPPPCGDRHDPPSIDIAHLAHELRAPLAAIHSLAELMAEARFGPVGDQRYETYVAGIRDSARHLLDVVQSMLETRDQPPAGTAVAAATDAEGTRAAAVSDSALVATEVVRALSALAADAGVKLILALAPGLPPVAVERTVLAQILFNLASNAIRHAGRGSVAIVRSGVDDVGRPWLEVEDNGQGMGRAHAADAGNGCANTAPVEPTARQGLGLLLTKALARQSGAELTLARAVPHGVRARVTFAWQAGTPVAEPPMA